MLEQSHRSGLPQKMVARQPQSISDYLGIGGGTAADHRGNRRGRYQLVADLEAICPSEQQRRSFQSFHRTN